MGYAGEKRELGHLTVDFMVYSFWLGLSTVLQPRGLYPFFIVSSYNGPFRHLFIGFALIRRLSVYATIYDLSINGQLWACFLALAFSPVRFVAVW
jgi:hypothetical protein